MKDYFHYSDDPTEKKLTEALEQLMTTKAIADITTSEILELSKVSRSTFYRKYKDKQDLLNKNYQHLLDWTIQEMAEGKSYKEACYALTNSIKESAGFFQDAFRIRDEKNNLGQYMQDTVYESFVKSLSRHGLDMTNSYYQLLLHGYLSAAMSVIYKWVDTGMRESAEELFHINYELMPTEIRSVIMLNYM